MADDANGWVFSGWATARIPRMPENNDDPEFKAALSTVLRDMIGDDFFGAGRTEEDWRNLVEALNANGKHAGLVPTLRRFHAEHGRYPAIRNELPAIYDTVPFNQ
jgi:hypothetical protein